MNNIPFLEKVRIQLLFGGIYALFKKSKVDIREFGDTFVSVQVERQRKQSQIMKLKYNENKQIIESFYTNLGLTGEFKQDNTYLETAFNEINKIWVENFNEIDKVKYLMIAEAPLWGKKKKYIYNPKTLNSQFFYRSDLETILNIQIPNKKEFIKTCKNIGLLCKVSK